MAGRGADVTMDDIRDRIAAAAGEIALSLSLDLVDVSLKRAPRRYMLRVIVDKQGGVSMGDCTSMSQALSQWLDATDPVPGAYNLQVTSPGLDRPLRNWADFQTCVGRLARVTVRREGVEQTCSGTIRSASAEAIELQEKAGGTLSFRPDDVVRARLDVDFGRKPGKGRQR